MRPVAANYRLRSFCDLLVGQLSLYCHINLMLVTGDHCTSSSISHRRKNAHENDHNKLYSTHRHTYTGWSKK